eukprot:6179336-Pleurochrysis_carterae.AAC.3
MHTLACEYPSDSAKNHYKVPSRVSMFSTPSSPPRPSVRPCAAALAADSPPSPRTPSLSAQARAPAPPAPSALAPTCTGAHCTCTALSASSRVGTSGGLPTTSRSWTGSSSEAAGQTCRLVRKVPTLQAWRGAVLPFPP